MWGVEIHIYLVLFILYSFFLKHVVKKSIPLYPSKNKIVAYVQRPLCPQTQKSLVVRMFILTTVKIPNLHKLFLDFIQIFKKARKKPSSGFLEIVLLARSMDGHRCVGAADFPFTYFPISLPQVLLPSLPFPSSPFLMARRMEEECC